MDPDYVTGFSDGEGTFSITISRRDRTALGWYPRPVFSIELHKRDLPLLKGIQAFFGGGGDICVRSNRNGSAILKFSELEILREVIIPHFIKYPLLTQKRADFELFAKAVYLISAKTHLTGEGLREIVALRFGKGTKIPADLLEAFPDIIPVSIPFSEPREFTPHWIAGFTDAEGCFDLDIYKARTSVGFGVTLRFRLVQHARDAKLINSLVSYLGCGTFWLGASNEGAVLNVRRLSDISNIIIPFFNKYPLHGKNKKFDFLDLCRVAGIMNKKKITSISPPPLSLYI